MWWRWHWEARHCLMPFQQKKNRRRQHAVVDRGHYYQEIGSAFQDLFFLKKSCHYTSCIHQNKQYLVINDVSQLTKCEYVGSWYFCKCPKKDESSRDESLRASIYSHLHVTENVENGNTRATCFLAASCHLLQANNSIVAKQVAKDYSSPCSVICFGYSKCIHQFMALASVNGCAPYPMVNTL